MKFWLIYQSEDVKKNDWYIHQYIEHGKSLGLEVELILTNQFTMECRQGQYNLLLNHQKAELPTAAIVRAIDPKLSRFLELLGVRVFNRAIISEICNDKGRTYQEIVPLGIPMVPTILCRHKELVARMKNVALPAVVKTVDGHGGQEVFLVHDLNSKLKMILEKTTSDYVIQPLVGNRHQDLRVYVLGQQVLAAILRTSNSEFKANYSLGGSVQPYALNESEVRLVQQIIQKFEFDLVGIDFIIGNDGELIFNEIEDVVGARMLYECTDVDIVLEYLKYIKDKLTNA